MNQSQPNLKYQKNSFLPAFVGAGRYVLSVFCAAVFATVLAQPGSGIAIAQEPTGLQMALAMEELLVEAIAKAEKSVVAISRVPRGERGGGDTLEPTDPDFVPDVFGSGVIIDRRGYILTNAHLLDFDEKKKDAYSYYVWHQKRPYKAAVVPPPKAEVTAVSGFHDLAVIKITPSSELTPIVFGDTTKLRKGNVVIALGNPYATGRDGEATASWGIISNLSRPAPRPIEQTKDTSSTLADYGTLIQCDARLNIGSSGGALINLHGKMIGLTTSLAALYGYEKAGGFAIPMDADAQTAIQRLKLGREPEVGFIGLQPTNLSADEIRQGRFGVALTNVIEGAPAAKAGLQMGDVITHIEGEKVYNKNTFMRDIAKRAPETPVRLRVNRSLFGRNRDFHVSVVLAKKFVESNRPSYASNPEPAWRGLQVDYSTAIPLDIYLNKLDAIDPKGCVSLPTVETDSLAWKSGARPWMFVSHVNGQRVSKPSEFRRIAEAASGAVELTMTTGDKFTVAAPSPE